MTSGLSNALHWREMHACLVSFVTTLDWWTDRRLLGTWLSVAGRGTLRSQNKPSNSQAPNDHPSAGQLQESVRAKLNQTKCRKCNVQGRKSEPKNTQKTKQRAVRNCNTKPDHTAVNLRDGLCQPMT